MKFTHLCSSTPLFETVIFFVFRKKLEESSGQRNLVTFFWFGMLSRELLIML